MALSVAEGEALIAAAQAAGQGSGSTTIFFSTPSFSALASSSGKERSARRSQPMPGRSADLNIPPWDFRLDRGQTGGGAWIDAGPHLVYTLAELLGPFHGSRRCRPGRRVASAGRTR